jgi:HNH endonuclease
VTTLANVPVVNSLFAPKGVKRTPLSHGLTWKQWKDLREQVLVRDHRRCIYYPACVGLTKGNGLGIDGQGKGLTIDHIIPYSVSHDNSLTNLRTLCSYHNALLGYRETVNPMLQLDQIAASFELGQIDRDLRHGFGPLRPAK